MLKRKTNMLKEVFRSILIQYLNSKEHYLSSLAVYKCRTIHFDECPGNLVSSVLDY